MRALGYVIIPMFYATGIGQDCTTCTGRVQYTVCYCKGVTGTGTVVKMPPVPDRYSVLARVKVSDTYKGVMLPYDIHQYIYYINIYIRHIYINIYIIYLCQIWAYGVHGPIRGIITHASEL